ncbi:MAG: cell division protein FtsQ [Prevotella sp.]|nr:cell division protein FtsQ [Prevotella sp.]
MRWKKVVIIILDIALAVYLGLAVTSFNHPDETSKVCTKVAINIADESTNGFLSAAEIKHILERNQIYPLEKRMAFVDPRRIEDILKSSPFVNTAQCYTTQDGHVCINITQRLPIVRIKSNNGDDYYLDDHGGIMPNSKYTSDLIIASGSINKWFAQTYLGCLSKTIMGNDLWRNLIEQIHVLPDRSIELVPRIGDNIVFIGSLPETNDKAVRQSLIDEYVARKMERLEKFYKYGLSEAGWNKYSYISLEFDNQIICKKKKHQPEN